MSSHNIDLNCRCIEVFRELGLTPFRKVLDPDLFKSVVSKRQPSNTILVPEVTFWLMASAALMDGAMRAAVQNYWTPLLAIFPDLHFQPVTDAAFCIARKKLSLRFFRNVFQALLDRFERDFSHRYRWKGLRLWGIDGSRIPLSPLSPRLRKAFPSTSNVAKPSKNPLGLLVSIVGLRDGVCKDFEMVSIRTSEQECARRLIRRSLRKGDMVLLDKNFAGYETFACFLSLQAHFLIRLASNKFTRQAHQKTPSGRKDEWFVTLRAPKKLRSVHPELPETITLRILKYQIPGFRPSRLITSLLDTQKYPYQQVAPLYHERWMHETISREWKQTLQISNLRSLHKSGVLKEIYVQLILNNAIRWIMAEAAGEEERPVNLKFLDAKRLILSLIPVMVCLKVEQLALLYRKMLAAIAQMHILKRPGRSFPRRFDKKPRNKGPGKIALPARIQPGEGGLIGSV